MTCATKNFCRSRWRFGQHRSCDTAESSSDHGVCGRGAALDLHREAAGVVAELVQGLLDTLARTSHAPLLPSPTRSTRPQLDLELLVGLVCKAGARAGCGSLTLFCSCWCRAHSGGFLCSNLILSCPYACSCARSVSKCAYSPSALPNLFRTSLRFSHFVATHRPIDPAVTSPSAAPS